MPVSTMIHKLRTDAHISQEQFADLFGVSRQSVQKWESGVSVPELDKLVKIAKYFDVSLDALVLGSSLRADAERIYGRDLKPRYENLHEWESYSSTLLTEYRQSIEEGLDIETYKDVFEAVARLPKDEIKKRMSAVLFDVVMHAKTVEGYPYTEPSDLEGIRALRKETPVSGVMPDAKTLRDKIGGAWLGRICGCMLGKTVEGIRTNELIPFLTETGNYPMHRYILRSEVTDDMLAKYTYAFAERCYADCIDGMPPDDDTNYVVLAQEVIEKYGRDFTPQNMADAWISLQPKSAYFTAERVAFCNFVKGFEPPQSAVYQNPYREWIGAQIRGDYFGYINPGNPQLAAEMAFRDASISHVKNGIYGEMFAAAMIAVAATTTDVKAILLGGLAQIPHTSRLYEQVMQLIEDYDRGVTQQECFARIHARYDEHNSHDWCHTISNALIVATALLYGQGDYGKSICMAVETGFDTDCNGATVGSILGMAFGEGCIDKQWSDPIHDTLYATIFGKDRLKISECADLTMKHIAL